MFVRGLRRLTGVLLAGVFAAGTIAAGSAAAAGDDTAVISPLGFLIVDEPHPVLGTDGRNHLAYELLVTNQSDLDTTIVSVQPTAGGKPIGSALGGDSLAAVMRINGGVEGTTIPAGGSATIFADVAYPAKAKPPRRLRHRFVLTGMPAQGGGEQQLFTFSGTPTKVSRERAVVVEPPLRGPGWVVGNGCCSPPNAHRGATLSINGTVRVPERFAIDFVQIDADGRLFVGPLDQNESYPFFGDRIFSATPGRVVTVVDGFPEQTPGSLPPGQTVQTAGGNHVVVDMGDGLFAFYAHMQPGSIEVRKGQKVKPGDVIGLLGNTGNTDGAHLHFHVMDSRSPLQSNGVPFVFDRMTGQGTVADLGALQAGEPATLVPGFSGVHRKELPLNNQVVKFAGEE
jgi:hypothetical protein